MAQYNFFGEIIEIEDDYLDDISFYDKIGNALTSSSKEVCNDFNELGANRKREGPENSSDPPDWKIQRIEGPTAFEQINDTNYDTTLSGSISSDTEINGLVTIRTEITEDDETSKELNNGPQNDDIEIKYFHQYDCEDNYLNKFESEVRDIEFSDKNVLLNREKEFWNDEVNNLYSQRYQVKEEVVSDVGFCDSIDSLNQDSVYRRHSFPHNLNKQEEILNKIMKQHDILQDLKELRRLATDARKLNLNPSKCKIFFIF